MLSALNSESDETESDEDPEVILDFVFVNNSIFPVFLFFHKLPEFPHMLVLHNVSDVFVRKGRFSSVSPTSVTTHF